MSSEFVWNGPMSRMLNSFLLACWGVLFLLLFITGCSNITKIIPPLITGSTQPSPTETIKGTLESSTPSNSDLSDRERIQEGQKISDTLQQTLETNDFIESIGLVSVIPLKDNLDQFSVYAEIKVKSGENSTNNATLLRLQTIQMIGNDALIDFSVIFDDGAQATEYLWIERDKDWHVTQLR